ncbi:uncharacterized protein B0I36DRAFT_417596 [Microdochium trichocladiopsis]|uniref:non-specific serine/threonine protein kinase n=1 Tax=Microdochium trichocladiopsis TaxID=1682393 RepID=A0A9P8XYU5_9PEZI|nr:uncharacterized protein B0I36DRAFT_417596 [Microdochium trichocladiopsis]KAH7025306.1 hypothetical protein B0I36DRAFT_417596 [Microdochium trichocladiopsis]
MADQARSQIIKENPIGKGLDAFRASFSLICEGASVPCTPDSLGSLDHEELQNLTLDLLLALQSLRISRLLRSSGSGKNLLSDLSRLNSAVNSDDFDLNRIKPLLNAALTDDPDDAVIWNEVYHAVTESTPPPRPTASSLHQTPWLHNTSSFANSSEGRKDVDRVLKLELGPLYIGLPRFCETYFGRVAGLERAAEAVFKECKGGSNPLFHEGWSGWPKDANQDDVLSWFAGLCEKLAAFAEHHGSNPACRRRPLAQPNKPIRGSTGERKLDVGFVNDTKADKDSQCHWSRVLVPGELKSNPLADTASKAWLDLGRYAREVLAAQDTRRFVLGFTICGSLMRIWEFDRLGGSHPNNGLQFVSTVLGFLWMNEEELGFDPTIMTANNERFIEIERDGSTERLIIDRVMKRAPCIAGRATTCWKAHREGQPQSLLVIKDSWQYTERDEEGELLREATGKGVVNMARYYHHETVRVHGKDDDIRSNVRGGLDVTRATNYRSERSMPPPSTTMSGASRKGRSNSIAGKKRSSSQTGAALPPSKRSCSASPTKASSNAMPNRVHRRVILRDYGEPIYKASSRSALLAALEGCIEGHESLRKAGFLHRDISINNLMINEDDDNISWPSFLIDLDLAVREQRQGASGAKGKTGTRAFMAIGALLGEQHSFMHDLESFFWVLFWICIHYNVPDANISRSRSKDLAADPDENPVSSPRSRVVPEFDQWNYISMELLAKEKKGQVSHEGDFIRSAEENFTPYYQPLIPWVNKLRKVVFPSGGRWEREDIGLYVRMKEILGEAQKDPKVLAGDGLAD